ncbi:HPr family phosphocarrier protein [bacterium]|jgi:phosphocarrier protein HPr|nr:HPr family phosphocarrier protein [bacterium]
MELQLKIRNPEGLHARPAGVFAKKAAEFQSNIQILAGGQLKSAKSIMALMSLGLKQDQEFTLIIDGPDAGLASRALAELVNSGFRIAADGSG